MKLIIPVISLWIGLLCCTLHETRAQSDSLVLNNGDVMVGEIKSMDKSVVTVKTDYSDSDFKVKWEKVQRIYSNREYLITLADGTRMNASIKTDTADARRVILTGEAIDLRPNIIDIVYIKPVEEDFLSRINASLDVGYNYTRNNNLQQFSIRSNIEYLGKVWSLGGSLDAVRSAQDDAENVRRTNGNIIFRYFLENDWFLLFSEDFLQNDEQKLKLRTASQGGVGKYFVHSNHAYFAMAVGAAWNNERYTDEELTDKNSLEGLVGTQLNMFNMGDLNLLTSLTAYPSITEKGRVRADFKFDLKYDLPFDFYIRLGYSHNFDNQPVEGAVKNDFVFQTSVGWSP